MKFNFLSTHVLTWFILVWPLTPAHAEIREVFEGSRPAGMGGAFTAVANDDQSMWTNPAGIARTRKARSKAGIHFARFPEILLGFNSGAKGFYDTLKSSSNDGLAEAIANSNTVSDKPFYLRLGVLGLIVTETAQDLPTAVGLFANTHTRITIDESIPTDARMTTITDTGANLGFALTSTANRLSFGMTARPTYRYSYEKIIPVTDLKAPKELVNNLKKDSVSGVGLGLDVGVLYTMADFWFPTVGIAIRNLPTGCQEDYLNPYSETRETVCGTKFSGGDNPDSLTRLDPTDLRVGISISPRIGRDFGIRLAADAHNIPIHVGGNNYGLDEIEIVKMLHGGLEIFSGNPLEKSRFAARLGANQGLLTYGASADFGWLQLEFASYGVDVSLRDKRTEDRRYMLTLSTGL